MVENFLKESQSTVGTFLLSKLFAVESLVNYGGGAQTSFIISVRAILILTLLTKDAYIKYIK